MSKIKKIVACILFSVMLLLSAPILECYAAGPTDYTSATEVIEFNKLYILKIAGRDEYTGERNYIWYKLIPRTIAETKVEIKNTTLSGTGWAEVRVYDSLLQSIPIRDNKFELTKGATYYLRLHSYQEMWDIESSFMLQTSTNAGSNSDSVNTPTLPPTQNPDSSADDKSNSDTANTNPGNQSGNNSTDTNPGNNSGNNDSDVDGVDSDFWDDDVDDNNGSDVYDDELPVPEITEVENGNRSITIVWSCDDADSIDGYYIYRSKDGKKWDKLATIRDTEIEDYEDKDVADGDICGYVIRSYTGESQSENSVPEYTCFLKKVTIKSVKSNASKKLNVKWSTNSKSSGYQIRFSTTKSYTNTTTSSVTVNSKSESSKTIGKLKGGKKYYVQIRAFRKYNGEVYYSGWTPTKSVRVKS